jgi:hypothetical protein
VIPVVLRSVAVLALVAGSSLSAPQEAQLTDFEECADKSHLGYREMRRHVTIIVLQQGLDLAGTVSGLEVVEEIWLQDSKERHAKR